MRFNLFSIISFILLFVFHCAVFLFKVARGVFGGTLDIMIAENIASDVKKHFSS